MENHKSQEKRSESSKWILGANTNTGKNETIITSREGIAEMYNNLSFLRRLYVWNKKRAYWGTPANISKWSKAVIKSNKKYTCPWGNGITTW